MKYGYFIFEPHICLYRSIDSGWEIKCVWDEDTALINIRTGWIHGDGTAHSKVMVLLVK